jgi:hypothetical protein
LFTCTIASSVASLMQRSIVQPSIGTSTFISLQDEAAAYLMGLWQLPSLLQQAVAWQRTPRLSGGGFGVVGAVHVATSLAFDRPVDWVWLERCGMAAHLPGWRELAERMDRSAA